LLNLEAGTQSLDEVEAVHAPCDKPRKIIGGWERAFPDRPQHLVLRQAPHLPTPDQPEGARVRLEGAYHSLIERGGGVDQAHGTPGRRAQHGADIGQAGRAGLKRGDQH
jgi:hypothetical protein